MMEIKLIKRRLSGLRRMGTVGLNVLKINKEKVYKTSYHKN